MSQFPDNLEPLLAGYIDGTLSKDELAQVEAYLDQQPELRDELQRMMLDSEYLRMLPQARPPQDISDTVGSQLEREMLLSGAGAPTRAAQQRFGLPGLAVAAMVLVGAGIGVLAFQILGSERRPLPVLAAMESTVHESAALVEAIPTTGRTAEEVFADAALRSRAVDAPSPAIVTAVPVTLDALPAAIEDEVVARIDLSEIADQPVVLVVESADLAEADRRVRGFLMDNGYAYLSSDDAHFPADALARGSRRGSDAASGGMSAPSVPPAPGTTLSNAAPPNAIGNAIEMRRADHEPTVMLARRVDLNVVRQLQSQLNEAPSTGELATSRDATDRSRYQPQPQRASLYTASVGDLKLKQIASVHQGRPQPAGVAEEPATAAAPAIIATEPDAQPVVIPPGQAQPASAGAIAAEPPAALAAPSAPPAAAVPVPSDAASASVSPADAGPDAGHGARLVQPGDVLTISLRGDAQMQVNVNTAVQVTVDADGFIDVPDRGVYQVRGLTAQQVAATLADGVGVAAQSPFSVAFVGAQAGATADAAKPVAEMSDSPTTSPSTAPSIADTAAAATAPVARTEADDAQRVDRVDLIIVVKPLRAPTDGSAAATTAPAK